MLQIILFAIKAFFSYKIQMILPEPFHIYKGSKFMISDWNYKNSNKQLKFLSIIKIVPFISIHLSINQTHTTHIHKMLLTELMQGSGFNESDVHAKRVGVLNYNF